MYPHFRISWRPAPSLPTDAVDEPTNTISHQKLTRGTQKTWSATATPHRSTGSSKDLQSRRTRDRAEVPGFGLFTPPNRRSRLPFRHRQRSVPAETVALPVVTGVRRNLAAAHVPLGEQLVDLPLLFNFPRAVVNPF